MGVHAEEPHPKVAVGDHGDRVPVVTSFAIESTAPTLFKPTCPTTRPLRNCSIACAITNPYLP